MGLRSAATVGVVLVATATFNAVPANSTPVGPIATINGTVPPAIVEHLHGEWRMLDAVEGDGLRHIVLQGTRRVGTRSPIHVHEVGGQTCVLTGAMTLFMEKQDPVTYQAG